MNISSQYERLRIREDTWSKAADILEQSAEDDQNKFQCDQHQAGVHITQDVLLYQHSSQAQILPHANDADLPDHQSVGPSTTNAEAEVRQIPRVDETATVEYTSDPVTTTSRHEVAETHDRLEDIIDGTSQHTDTIGGDGIG